MRKIKNLLLILLFIFSSISISNLVYAGHYEIPITDEASESLFSFIDLRDRETYVQVTNTDSTTRTVHVQIFNVDQNCNENNFFDTYTPNDTHVYNMREILTNDGNPSGVVLPENAYGFVVVSIVDSNGNVDFNEDFLIGNLRILDNRGYEYRTNSSGSDADVQPEDQEWYFNFNTNNGVLFSDVVFITTELSNGEWVAGPTEAYWALDVDIFNLEEVPFSCRDVTFSCVDADNPLLDQLLSDSNTSVAAFEYGINEAIPHSRGGELLCPGNTISEGWLRLNGENTNSNNDARGGFIGLNNGNGRGSIDTIWQRNCYENNNVIGPSCD